ncbi:MAG: hypothetical protein JNJ54_34370 [Myxococcaceae bacterium]|nr:hypothetical protein [Myxococcaceae bacterium]
MHHSRAWLWAGMGAFAVGVVFACGADKEVAPAPAVPQMQQCRRFEELMPRFVGAISTGKTQNLKTVVENQLLKTPREDVPPPLNDVLRIIFVTLNALASKPPEPGGTKDNYCAPANMPPPLNLANEVCELRRALDTLVHQGKGLEALAVIEPQLQGILDYMTGTGTSSDKQPHYEVAAAFSNLCANTAQCQLTNGLDLIIAFTDFSNTPAGRKLVQDLNTLGTKGSLTAFLAPQNLSEDGFVAISRALIPAVQAADPQALQSAFDQLPLSPELKADLGPIVEDLKVILQQPAIVEPMRKALNCITVADRNSDIVRMLYRLAIRDMRPEFGVTRLSQIFKQLQDVDQRGSLIFLANTLAKAVRSDETAITSAASTCKTLLSTAVPPGQSQSNAQLALPVVAELTRNGLVQEGICAIDTLLFGCSGGPQPACPMR